MNPRNWTSAFGSPFMKSNAMDNKYVKVVWDQDDPRARELPDIVEVPDYIPDEDVEDYISDTYGVDVESYNIL